jgi:hypothetical protein
MKHILTQKYLKSILKYNKNTGIFKWKKELSKCIKNKEIAGTISKLNGYAYIGINGKIYKAHRLAWLYVYGHFPKQMIDHINRKKTDNRICNLRDVSRSVNGHNKGLQSNNTSGHKGIYLDKRDNIWFSQIKINNKIIHLGRFKYKKDAITARKESEIKYNLYT